MERAKEDLKSLAGTDTYHQVEKTSQEELADQVSDGEDMPSVQTMLSKGMTHTVTAKDNWRYKNAEQKDTTQDPERCCFVSWK